MRALKILFYSMITLVVMAFVVRQFLEKHTLEGKGPVTVQEIEVSGFDEISISGAWQVTLVPGAPFGLSLSMQENLHPAAKVRIDGQRLEIGLQGNVHQAGVPMKARISAPAFRKIKTSGGTELSSENQLEGRSLEIDLSGASAVKLELNVQQLSINSSGASKLDLWGAVQGAEVEMSGASQLKGGDCVIGDLSVKSSGAAQTDVHVTGTLSVKASGASSVRYAGEPTQVETKLSGAASAKKQ